MDCPSCGATGQAGRFCMRCRKRLAEEPGASTSPRPAGSKPAATPPATSIQRPVGARPAVATRATGIGRPVVVERLSTLALLQGAFAAVYVILVPTTLMMVLSAPLVVLPVIAAVGLRQLKPWGRFLGILYSALTLLAIPLGTVLGGFLLAYLFKPEVKAAFSEDPASAALAAQARDLWRPLAVVIGVVNILLVLALAGFAVALILPRFLR